MLKTQTKKIKNRKVSKILAGILSFLMFATSNGSFLVWGLSEGQLNFLGEPAVAQAKTAEARVIETADAITVDEITQESQPKSHWWTKLVGLFNKNLKTDISTVVEGDKNNSSSYDDLVARYGKDDMKNGYGDEIAGIKEQMDKNDSFVTDADGNVISLASTDNNVFQNILSSAKEHVNKKIIEPVKNGTTSIRTNLQSIFNFGSNTSRSGKNNKDLSNKVPIKIPNQKEVVAIRELLKENGNGKNLSKKVGDYAVKEVKVRANNGSQQIIKVIVDKSSGANKILGVLGEVNGKLTVIKTTKDTIDAISHLNQNQVQDLAIQLGLGAAINTVGAIPVAAGAVLWGLSQMSDKEREEFRDNLGDQVKNSAEALSEAVESLQEYVVDTYNNNGKKIVTVCNDAICQIGDTVSDIANKAGESIMAVMPSENIVPFVSFGDGEYFYSTDPNNKKIYRRTKDGKFEEVNLVGKFKEGKLTEREIIEAAKEDAWNGSGSSEYFLNSENKDLYTNVYNRELQKVQSVNNALNEVMTEGDLFGFSSDNKEDNKGITGKQKREDVPELQDYSKVKPVNWENNPDKFVDADGKLTEGAKKAGYILKNGQVINKNDIQELEKGEIYSLNEKTGKYEKCGIAGRIFGGLADCYDAEKLAQRDSNVVVLPVVRPTSKKITIEKDKYYEFDDKGKVRECFFNTTLFGCTKGSEFGKILNKNDDKVKQDDGGTSKIETRTNDSIGQIDQVSPQTEATDEVVATSEASSLMRVEPGERKQRIPMREGDELYNTPSEEGSVGGANKSFWSWLNPLNWFGGKEDFDGQRAQDDGNYGDGDVDIANNNGDRGRDNYTDDELREHAIFDAHNYGTPDSTLKDNPRYIAFYNQQIGNTNKIIDNNNQQLTDDEGVNSDNDAQETQFFDADGNLLYVNSSGESDVLQSAGNGDTENNPVNAPPAGNDFGFNQFVERGLLPGLVNGGQRGILAMASGADNDEVLGIIVQDVIGSSMVGAVDAVFGEDTNGDGIKEAGWLAHSMGNAAAGIITALTVGDKGDAIEAAANLVFETGVNALADSGVIKPEDVNTIRGATTSYLGQGMIDMARDLTNGVDFDEALEHGLTTAAVGYINQVVIPENADLWGGTSTDIGLTGAGLTAGVSSLGRQLLNGRIDVGELGEDIIQGVATQYAIDAIGDMAFSTAIDSLAPNVGVDIAQEVGSRAASEAIGSYGWMARAAITVGRMLIDGEIDVAGLASTALSIGATVVANIAIYGTASGIATGAAAGSVVPGLGTAIGAVVGLVAGMLMGGSGPKDYEIADWKASASEAINPSLIVKGLNPAVSQAITQVAQSGDVDKAKQMMRQALENTALGRLAMMSGLSGLLDSAVALMNNRITRLRNDFEPGELEGYTGDNIHTGDAALDEATNKYMHLKNKLKDCYLRKDQDCVGDVAQEIRGVRNGLIALATTKFNDEIAELNKEIHDLENQLAQAKTAKEKAELQARLREKRNRRDILRNARDQYNEVARSCPPGKEWHFVDHYCMDISKNKAHCEGGGGTWHGSLVTGTTGCTCDAKPGGHWMGNHCEYGFSREQQHQLDLQGAADECRHRIGHWRWDGQHCVEVSSKPPREPKPSVNQATRFGGGDDDSEGE